MRLSPRHWRAPHLVLAWVAYWGVLALVALGPALRAAWRVSRPGAHGSVGASFGDGMVRLTVTGPGAPPWTGAASVGALTAWLVGPPLVLWLLWVLSRPRRAASDREAPPGLGASGPRAALPAAVPGATSHVGAAAEPPVRGPA